MPRHTWRGWAALLAERLGPPGAVEFHNLAELGAQSHTLASCQLPAAVELPPTIAAVIVGVNDTFVDRSTSDGPRPRLTGRCVSYATRARSC